jgi:hypothetical protein
MFFHDYFWNKIQKGLQKLKKFYYDAQIVFKRAC